MTFIIPSELYQGQMFMLCKNIFEESCDLISNFISWFQKNLTKGLGPIFKSTTYSIGIASMDEVKDISLNKEYGSLPNTKASTLVIPPVFYSSSILQEPAFILYRNINETMSNGKRL